MYCDAKSFQFTTTLFYLGKNLLRHCELKRKFWKIRWNILSDLMFQGARPKEPTANIVALEREIEHLNIRIPRWKKLEQHNR